IVPGFAGSYEKKEGLTVVIDAVEGQTQLQRCLADTDACTRGCGGMCSLYNAFEEIQNDLAAKLKSVNFADLAAKEMAMSGK
ncbi:MAG: Rrf2 family transcriptional regulator, partial [Anaeroglobus sp.]